MYHGREEQAYSRMRLGIWGEHLTKSGLERLPQGLLLLLVFGTKRQVIFVGLVGQLNHVDCLRREGEDSEDVRRCNACPRDARCQEKVIAKRRVGVYVEPIIAAAVVACGLDNDDLVLDNGNCDRSVVHDGFEGYLIQNFMDTEERASSKRKRGNSEILLLLEAAGVWTEY